jgi:hypothetical protein
MSLSASEPMNEDSHMASQAEAPLEGRTLNTPYLLLPFLDIQLLRLIAEMLGPRCYICNERPPVLGRIDGHWEWSCLTCSLFMLDDHVGGQLQRESLSGQSPRSDQMLP